MRDVCATFSHLGAKLDFTCDTSARLCLDLAFQWLFPRPASAIPRAGNGAEAVSGAVSETGRIKIGMTAPFLP
jgi:hypothetical protein